MGDSSFLTGQNIFDEFTIEQLAGDFIPKPYMTKLTATAFSSETR